jgi:serine/threonine-protein kinase
MSDMEVRPIRGTKSLRAVASPVFSPDGQSVAFHALLDNTLKRVSIAGGAPVTICPADNPTGISWGRDGIVFGQGAKGVMRVSADGGTPEQVVTLERDEYVQGPQMLPDGEHLLFSVASGSLSNRWDTARLMTHSLRSGERKVLITGASDGRYVPTGHLIYLVSGTMFAVPFDLERLEVKGGAVPVVEGVRRASQDQSGAADFAFSDSGTLVYQPGPAAVIGGQVQLVVADRKGVVTPLNVAAGAYETPRVSPDGIRVAVSAADQNGSTIWIYSLAGTGAAQRLTSGGNSRYPIWTSDGKRIAFQSDRDGDAAIFWQPADGSGSAERLTKPEPNTSHTPESWAADGNSLLFSVTKGLDVSLWVLSLRDRKTTPFGNVRSSTPPDAAFSPDGRWVAYAMTEQGATRMYVEPFPATGSRYQLVSQPSDSAHHPVWTRDGKELIYTPRPGALEAVSVTTTPALAFGTPVAWARPFETGPPSRRRPFDVTPGGTLVGVVAPGPSDTRGPRLSPRIHVVLNWFEELKRLVPVK